VDRLLTEVLEAWRSAERTLDEMPASSPDHETIVIAIARLRSLYQELAAARHSSRMMNVRATETITSTRHLIALARERLEDPSVQP
jgi:hypothetical protein